MSVLQHHHIIDLGDLRRAGQKSSAYREPQDNVVRGARAPEDHSTQVRLHSNVLASSAPLLKEPPIAGPVAA